MSYLRLPDAVIATFHATELMQLPFTRSVLTRFYNMTRIEKESFRLYEMNLLKPDQRSWITMLQLQSMLALGIQIIPYMLNRHSLNQHFKHIYYIYMQTKTPVGRKIKTRYLEIRHGVQKVCPGSSVA